MIDKKDIDLIDQYLRGELKGDFLDSFNNRVKTDPEFVEELELMIKISTGFKDFGRQELRNKLKTIGTKKQKIKHRSKKIIYWSIAASLLILIGLSGYFYLVVQKPVEQKFVFNTIRPPFEKADIKYKVFQLQADKGAVLTYKTGTIITVPQNAFVDKKGEVVKGNVSVRYRELTNPEELFIAGIPMNYDSAGHVLNMQTAGVCELQAYKDDSLLTINPANKINIDFSTKFENAEYSLLLFDTISKKWQKQGGDTNVIKLDEYISDIPHANVYVPRKADHSKPRFKLVFRDPSKFPELAGYKNYSFEVSDNEKNYKPEEANINWKSVSIDKDAKTGEYLVTFINPDRQITYKTNAVFEDKDYQTALNTYHQKTNESQSKLLTGADQITSQNATRIKALQKELSGKEKDDFSVATIYRTFAISKAGLWCYSRIINKPLGGNIIAGFVDTKGDLLKLQYVAILDRTQNAILRYTPEEFKSLRFDPTSQNVLVAITLNENFAYLKKEDFAKLPKSGNCSVTLQIAPKKPESSNEIMDLIS